MSMQTQPQKKRRPRDAKGVHKLAVFFLDHRQIEGKPYYFRSTRRQDLNSTAKKRLKYLVSTKWAGKVNWAGLYENNQLIAEFKIADNLWQSPSKAAKLP